MTRDILGPDLTTLPSLEQQLAVLDEAKAAGDVREYVERWLAISDAIGGGATAQWWGDESPDAPPQILVGCFCDAQESERRRRNHALHDHHLDVTGWRAAIEHELLRQRRFCDNRRAPLKEVKAVVRAFLAAGGRLTLPPVAAARAGDTSRVDAHYDALRILGDQLTPPQAASVVAMSRILRRWRARAPLHRIVRRLGTRTDNGWIILEANQ